jgi:glutathione S-transferase
MLSFYFSPGSSSMAPHIALHEVGAVFDAKPVSFATKEHQSPEFRAINPEGKVPTLLIDGRRLTEVAGILFYLAKRGAFPNLERHYERMMARPAVKQTIDIESKIGYELPA